MNASATAFRPAAGARIDPVPRRLVDRARRAGGGEVIHTAVARDERDPQDDEDRIDPVLVVLWIALVALAAVWICALRLHHFHVPRKSNATVMGESAFAPPHDVDIGNYPAAWARGHFSTTVFNSTVITIVKVPRLRSR